MSYGLRDVLGVKRQAERQGYAFRGTTEESEVQAFCREENVIYDDFVRANITNQILYKYPQLFDVLDFG